MVTKQKVEDKKGDGMTTKKEPARIDIEADAKQAAEEAAAGRSATILEKVTDRIGAHSGAKAVFGDPVEKGGRTVVPVAQSMWGSGAGYGESEEEGAGGGGGGGGAMSRPLGYIEMDEDGARFVPLQQPWQDARLILAYAFGFWLVVRALSRLIRG